MDEPYEDDIEATNDELNQMARSVILFMTLTVAGVISILWII